MHDLLYSAALCGDVYRWEEMRIMQTINSKIKRGIYSWLNIQPANPYSIQINEVLDFELNAIRNRIWYRGDGNELEQMYSGMPEYADKYKFWASRSTPGMEMRKIHTGMPGLIVRVLTAIVLPDMNNFEFKDKKQEGVWQEIEKQNKFRERMKKVLKDVLFIGDGAWKIVLDTSRSDYPFIHWYPGDRVELRYEGDELQEVIFKTPYKYSHKEYVLYEHYGYGYIKNELYHKDVQVNLGAIPQTADIKDYSFDKKAILGVPFKIFDNAKWENRGGSIYDGKLDSFDALDEAWSQWMDALRAGRAKTYIPETLIPRDPRTGQFVKPNAFDNRFIASSTDMGEHAKNEISTEQPAIPHDSYMATYITALDLCLQGIISPSTLGIDVKKLDNAEATREKEKATLYTRNAIVEALTDIIPELIGACINCVNILNGKAVENVDVSIPFGEYANPSFEACVQTISQARQSGIMSVEACVEELYGDTQDNVWKQEEIKRLKAEQGITEMDNPAIGTAAEQLIGGGYEGQDNEPHISNERTGVSGAAADGE